MRLTTASVDFRVRTKVQSIRQNDLPDALPDFRNLGVISRILLSVNALALLFALARSREIGEFEIGRASCRERV